MATKTKDFEKKLFQVVRELNVSQDRVEEFLEEEGYTEALSGAGLNAKIVDEEAYLVLREEYADDAEAAERIRELRSQKDDTGAGQHDEVATLEEDQEAEPAAEAEQEEETADVEETESESEASVQADAAETAPDSPSDEPSDEAPEVDKDLAEPEASTAAEDVTEEEEVEVEHLEGVSCPRPMLLEVKVGS